MSASSINSENILPTAASSVSSSTISHTTSSSSVATSFKMYASQSPSSSSVTKNNAYRLPVSPPQQKINTLFCLWVHKCYFFHVHPPCITQNRIRKPAAFVRTCLLLYVHTPIIQISLQNKDCSNLIDIFLRSSLRIPDSIMCLSAETVVSLSSHKITSNPVRLSNIF